jgi:hypothetical protein
MSALGGLNKAPNGVVLGLVQLLRYGERLDRAAE